MPSSCRVPSRPATLGLRSLLVAGALLSAAALSAGCAGGSTKQEPAPCSADAPCSAGQRCASGVCVLAECAAGATRPCGPQPVGACRQGTQSCVDGLFETGCPGQVLPSAELCDAELVDENCDGAANEGCGCAPIDATVACCSGRGEQICLPDAGGSAYSACTVSPETEICNGIDDDCDGLVDEEDSPLCGAGSVCVAGTCGCAGGAAPLGCLVDADGDLRSPDLSALTSLCAVADRPAQGGCPAGFVLPTFAQGLDCDDTDAARFSLQSLRTDQDGDAACVGTVTVACLGAATPAGQRLAAACQATDDCDDTSATAFRLASVRNDADGDAYCTGLASSQCIGSVAPAGRRLTATCQPTDDCNDANAAVFVVATLRADADGDAYCVGAAVNVCIGAGTPSGLRPPGACQPMDDCNDANAATFAVATVRTDADADGFCVGAASSMCVGASLPAGQRLAATCTSDDCRDSNPLANWSCVLPQGYVTASVVKSCFLVPATQTFTVSATQICPLGFQIDPGSVTAQNLVAGGFCTAVSTTSVTATCNGLDGPTCRVVADCVAL